MYTASASFKQNLDIFEFKNITLQIKIWTDHHCHRVPKIERVSKCVQTFEHIMDTFWTLRCILDTLFKKKFFKHSVQNVSKLLDTFWTLRCKPWNRTPDVEVLFFPHLMLLLPSHFGWGLNPI